MIPTYNKPARGRTMFFGQGCHPKPEHYLTHLAESLAETVYVDGQETPGLRDTKFIKEDLETAANAASIISEIVMHLAGRRPGPINHHIVYASRILDWSKKMTAHALAHEDTDAWIQAAMNLARAKPEPQPEPETNAHPEPVG